MFFSFVLSTRFVRFVLTNENRIGQFRRWKTRRRQRFDDVDLFWHQGNIFTFVIWCRWNNSNHRRIWFGDGQTNDTWRVGRRLNEEKRKALKSSKTKFFTIGFRRWPSVEMIFVIFFVVEFSSKWFDEPRIGFNSIIGVKCACCLNELWSGNVEWRLNKRVDVGPFFAKNNVVIGVETTFRVKLLIKFRIAKNLKSKKSKKTKRKRSIYLEHFEYSLFAFWSTRKTSSHRFDFDRTNSSLLFRSTCISTDR